jgi:hypothetical protein
MTDFVADTVGFWRDGFTTPLTWMDVIGTGAVTRINVQATAYSAGKRKLPDVISVELLSRHANGRGTAAVPPKGDTTLPVPRRVELKRMDMAPADAPRSGQRKTYYRLELNAVELGFSRPTGRNTVATVVRKGGTSDDFLRRGLGFPERGTAIQPARPSERSGSQESEQPDAMTLFLAGGVELLDVRFVPRQGWKPPVGSANPSRLIRSPATLFYYSGHGLFDKNCLAIETGQHEFECWLSPQNLIEAWRAIGKDRIDILTIAGCSVLSIHTPRPGQPAEGPGLAWLPLLARKGGLFVSCWDMARSAGTSSPSASQAIFDGHRWITRSGTRSRAISGARWPRAG